MSFLFYRRLNVVIDTIARFVCAGLFVAMMILWTAIFSGSI